MLPEEKKVTALKILSSTTAPSGPVVFPLQEVPTRVPVHVNVTGELTVVEAASAFSEISQSGQVTWSVNVT
jgi:hypothetical protein